MHVPSAARALSWHPLAPASALHPPSTRYSSVLAHCEQYFLPLIHTSHLLVKHFPAWPSPASVHVSASGAAQANCKTNPATINLQNIKIADMLHVIYQRLTWANIRSDTTIVLLEVYTGRLLNTVFSVNSLCANSSPHQIRNANPQTLRLQRSS